MNPITFKTLLAALLLSIGLLTANAPTITYVHPVQEVYHPKHEALIQRLIQCESQGRNVSRLDSNGRYSDGILQYNRGPENTLGSGTWAAFSKASGIKGNPIIPEDAIRLTDWAISNGLINHWSCAKILGLK